MSTATRRASTPAAPDWTGALCAQTDPDLFFPAGHNQASDTRQAKRMCQRCPIQRACAEWAIREGIRDGVWGGLSEDDRRPFIPDRKFGWGEGVQRCLDQQEVLEDRVAEQRSYRQIAEELGVDRTSVRRAVQMLRREEKLAGGVSA
ncbi:WhiB family transcriptional regulator [Streptomyces longwoodensis]|uniref:WhiB family transcriptional regulator n=1 Tax=Streptomyces longwoodensis TaxID=68231 RepID=UPI00225912F2|nr:WhiB family transcriptional regulator [Streptomyces longwoodensis]MCX5000927.1 WhiB family transcriptional regulator [Streptomyces longwoodensis]